MVRMLSVVCGLAAVAVVQSLETVLKMQEKQVGAQSGTRGTPQTQVADLSLGANMLKKGNLVWLDLQESSWYHIPGWLRDVVHMIVPSSKLEGGTKQMFWQCGTNVQRCEIYAFAYSCTGCDYEEGGFRALMAANQFRRIACGLSVFSRTNGHRHGMTGFVKNLAPGETFILPLDAPTVEFVTFGYNEEPSPECGTHGDEAACEGTGGKCAWDDTNGCDLNQAICRRRDAATPGGFGPGASQLLCTDKCINNDL